MGLSSNYILGFGLPEIQRYFDKSQNHLDKDILHVSKEELLSAKGKLTVDGNRVLEAILSAPKNYELIRNVQKEGVNNDEQISMLDLSAINRRTGVNGEKVDLVPFFKAVDVGLLSTAQLSKPNQNSPIIKLKDGRSFQLTKSEVEMQIENPLPTSYGEYYNLVDPLLTKYSGKKIPFISLPNVHKTGNDAEIYYEIKAAVEQVLKEGKKPVIVLELGTYGDQWIEQTIKQLKALPPNVFYKNLNPEQSSDQFLFPISQYATALLAQRKVLNVFEVELDPATVVNRYEGYADDSWNIWVTNISKLYGDKVQIIAEHSPLSANLLSSVGYVFCENIDKFAKQESEENFIKLFHRFDVLERLSNDQRDVALMNRCQRVMNDKTVFVIPRGRFHTFENLSNSVQMLNHDVAMKKTEKRPFAYFIMDTLIGSLFDKELKAFTQEMKGKDEEKIINQFMEMVTDKKLGSLWKALNKSSGPSNDLVNILQSWFANEVDPLRTLPITKYFKFGVN